jgi:c-di-GMP phosphodiesterase Gmr
MAHLPLRVLKALLSAERDGEPFSTILAAIRDAFSFNQAMVLGEGEGGWHCVAAVPQALTGLRWSPGPFCREIAGGRVATTCADHELEEWQEVPRDVLSPAQPALYLPVCVHGRRGLLMLLRAAGKDSFVDADLAVARQFAVIGLAALAARQASAIEAEFRELRGELDELHQRASEAQRTSDLLQGIIARLPVGLTVEDEQGRPVLVNDAAATRLAVPAVQLTARNDVPSPAAAFASRSQAKAATSPLQGEVGVNVDEVEETAAGGDGGQHTWLTARKPVRVGDETLVVSTSLDITRRKRLESELARRAYSDELTGLANRAMIEEHVETVLRGNGGNERFALAFIDLDNFKHINDYYNHAIGDALLVNVAQRISAVVRATDMLARISGDEFVLLVNPVESDEHILATIDGLLEKLKQPFHIEGFEMFTSASIGVSMYPDHGGSYEELRRNADSAMYRAKSGAKGAVTFYDLDMGATVTARMGLEQRLRLAIRDRQFCCAFQPKVDIRSQEVVGFEALLRWRGGNAEIQPPGAFIGLATELGLIDPITQFVLADAIRSLDLLDGAFGSGTSIAINVAAKQAGDVKFMRSFVERLKESDRADRFIVEVTEDAFIAKNQFQDQVLPMLREIGVRVSIDDFGTGYSSLSVLADITVDEIKIDRSFITAIHQRPRSQSILKAIESVSEALSMSVVAEGVETFDELAYLLAATRIRYAQGYHFARPFFLEDVVKSSGVAGDERAVEIGRERAETRAAATPRAAAGARGG